MSLKVTNYLNVREKLEELGLEVPTGMAFLPLNLREAEQSSDLLRASSESTVKTLFRNEAVPFEEIFSDGIRPPMVQNNSIEWVGPVLFVSAAVASQDPSSMAVAFDVVRNYVTDFFRGKPGKKTVKLSVVVEKEDGRTCRMIKYEGEVGGLEELKKAIREIVRD